MDPADFQTLAAADNQLRDFLNEIARHSKLARAPETFATGLEPLAAWACYALFRWSKMVIDARQRQLELDTTRQQIQLINDLVEEGWPREQAQALVPALLEGLKARQSDTGFQDSLQKAIEHLKNT